MGWGHPDQGALLVEGVQIWRSVRREGVLAKPSVHWSSVAWETGAWLWLDLPPAESAVEE